MCNRYDCPMSFLGRATMLGKILYADLSGLEELLRCLGISDEKVDPLEALSSDILKMLDLYMSTVDDIVRPQ